MNMGERLRKPREEEYTQEELAEKLNPLPEINPSGNDLVY